MFVKKFILISLIGIASFSAFAQQDPMFTQYMHNELIFNPAYAGSHNKLSMTALYRKQWAGFDGAPTTQVFTAHTPLPNEQLGTGLSVYRDKIGVTTKYFVNGAFSYRIPLNDKGDALSFGLQAGATMYNSDVNTLAIKDVNDPVFDKAINKTFPNIGAGVYYYSAKSFIGFSAPRMLNGNVDLGGKEVNLLNRHYFATAGYVFTLTDKLKLQPSLFGKILPGAPFEMDITSNLIYKDRFWVGLTYRTKESIDIMLMGEIIDNLRVGYSYDYITNDLKKSTSGSHEIMLNYRINWIKEKEVQPKKFVTPRYF